VSPFCSMFSQLLNLFRRPESGVHRLRVVRPADGGIAANLDSLVL
jgi:hypothetical protein